MKTSPLKAKALTPGMFISVPAVGGGGEVIRTSPAPDPGAIRVGYRYGKESWQVHTTTLRKDARVDVVTRRCNVGGAHCPECATAAGRLHRVGCSRNER